MKFSILSQQPAYFFFGEEQFKGAEIYDIIQADNHNYLFATNDGLYKYNFISFEKIANPQAKSTSVFNLVKDKLGNIYCTNTNRQVFQIKDGVCKVFYELTSEEIGPDLSITVNEQNELLISSHVIIVMNHLGKTLSKQQLKSHYISQPSQLPSGEVLYHIADSDTMLIYHQGKFKAQKLNQTPKVLKVISHQQKQFAIDVLTKKTYKYRPENGRLDEIPSNEILKRSPSVRLYETSNGIWGAGTLPGVFHIPTDVHPNKIPVLFENYFISDVFVDHEGNILLSTFDKGVIVIPDLQIEDVVNKFEDDPITQLFSSQNNLFAGSSEGLLFQYKNKQLNNISKEGKRPVNVFVGNERFILYDDGFIRSLDTKTGEKSDIVEASLKAGISIGDNKFLLGTNLGIFQVDFNETGSFKTKRWNELFGRVHLMNYDNKNQKVYVSTSDGLFVCKDNDIKKVHHNEKDIFPLDIECHQGKLYVLTRENGVLVFTNDKFTNTILIKKGEKRIDLKSFKFQNNRIYAACSNGFYQINLKGEIERYLDIEFGFPAKRILAYTFHQNELWVSHTGGLQKLNLAYKQNNKLTLKPRFLSILINNKKIEQLQNQQFSSHQNKVQFVITTPTLKNKELIQYHYRLLGSDSKWMLNEKGQHMISFNSLSPGNYEFQVKAEYQGVFGKTLKFKFSIQSPIYLRWWFISLIVILFLALVYGTFRRQLAIQKRKSDLINELHASKLTAIQSQMNPHFIFNSLNSIQDLILKKDVLNSYSYITTFSNLVRKTLSYSEKDFIAFEDEIQLLALYLSLEKLRFKNELTYTINTEGIEDILIPPLLIQPFVENALVHGLLHKEGTKNLTLKFQLKEELICIIEDNGIGREEAKQIRIRQRGDHESFSSEAIKKRFEILTQLFVGKFGFEFEDLIENNTVKGTRVALKIPYKSKF